MASMHRNNLLCHKETVKGKKYNIRILYVNLGPRVSAPPCLHSGPLWSTLVHPLPSWSDLQWFTNHQTTAVEWQVLSFINRLARGFLRLVWPEKYIGQTFTDIHMIYTGHTDINFLLLWLGLGLLGLLGIWCQWPGPPPGVCFSFVGWSIRNTVCVVCRF